MSPKVVKRAVGFSGPYQPTGIDVAGTKFDNFMQPAEFFSWLPLLELVVEPLLADRYFDNLRDRKPGQVEWRPIWQTK